ncbi:acyl carrier protein [Streptomyces sp. NPDC048664]|uniref:acyl carrier protein n=1 Tax=Streptomyces sp. NPDC048664 TaxID=3154505 RepID=UPI003423FEB2
MTGTTAHGRLGTLPDPAALGAMSPDLRARLIGHCLRLEVQHLLAVPPAHRVFPDRSLSDQGLDSLGALFLQRRIRCVLRREVSSEVLRTSTVDQLVDLLAR